MRNALTGFTATGHKNLSTFWLEWEVLMRKLIHWP